MFAISQKLILFMKGFKAQSGYYLMGDPPRWHRWDKDHKAPKGAHHVVDHTAHSAAVEALQKVHHSAHAKSAAEMVGEVVMAGKKIADERNALRRLSEVKRDLMAGKKPAAGALEWFWLAPKAKRDAVLAQALASSNPDVVARTNEVIAAAPEGAVTPAAPAAPAAQIDLFGDSAQPQDGQGHAEGDKWVMPLDTAISEHKELAQVAATPTQADDAVEQQKQQAELGRMQAEKQAQQEAAPAVIPPGARVIFPPVVREPQQPLPSHPATRVLSAEERNAIRKDNALFDKYGDRAEGGRAKWKALAESGALDNLMEEHQANEKAVADGKKAAQRAKNDAWREKNLPRLRANKITRENEERRQAEQRAKQEAEFAAKQEAHRIKQAALAEEYRKQEAEAQAKAAEAERKAAANRPLELPKTGRVSEDDPSVYGSWLLGHEGEPWANVRKLAPAPTPAPAPAPAAAPVPAPEATKTQDQPNAQQIVATEEQYLAMNGAPFMDGANYALHKNRAKSERNHQTYIELSSRAMAENNARRELLRKEYREKLKKGEVRAPTMAEEIERSKDAPESDAAAAMRRVYEKHQAQKRLMADRATAEMRAPSAQTSALTASVAPAPAATGSPQPSAFDHGVLNIPGRTGNINAELDRYKDQQKKEAKAKSKADAEEMRTDKATAKELLSKYLDAIVAKHGGKFGVKELRHTLDQWAKWEPKKLIKFVEAFQKEQAGSGATPQSLPPAPASTQAEIDQAWGEASPPPSAEPAAPRTGKTYLNVPFARKDEAKAHGARWDSAMRKWYYPAGGALPAGLEKFTKALPLIVFRKG